MEDDSAHLPYNAHNNDDSNLDVSPKPRQHLELTNASAATAATIDPRILVSRYYGHRIVAPINPQQQYSNAH